MNRIKQLNDIREHHQSMVEEKGDIWDKDVEALDWAINFIKEANRERARSFAARWQQTTKALLKHKAIEKIKIVPKDPPEIKTGVRTSGKSKAIESKQIRNQ